MTSARTACAVLTIDLDALASNWRLLNDHMVATGGECAGVVKGNGYGLGVAPVARTLYTAGCRTFFVAQIDEGVRLRAALHDVVTTGHTPPAVYVLCGLLPKTAEVFAEYGLAPVLSTPEQIAEYRGLPTETRAAMPRRRCISIPECGAWA